MPFFSIVMPVYNVQNYIRDSLSSLINQSFNDYEIVLVDDGSNDRSIEVAKDVLQNTSVDFSILTQPNSGVSAARNHGVDNSKGEWIICIDPDDVIHCDTLKLLHRIILDNNDINVIGFSFKYVNSFSGINMENKTESNYVVVTNKVINDEFLYRKKKIISPGLVLKREFIMINNICYDPTVFFSEDQLYIWNVLSKLENFVFVYDELYYYLVRPNSIMTSSKIEKILTGYRAFKELNDRISNNEIYCGKNGCYIFPRWVLGVLHSSAKHMKFNEFRNLAVQMDYNTNLRFLKGMKDIKSRILANGRFLGLRFLFFIMKRI